MKTNCLAGPGHDLSPGAGTSLQVWALSGPGSPSALQGRGGRGWEVEVGDEEGRGWVLLMLPGQPEAVAAIPGQGVEVG